MNSLPIHDKFSQPSSDQLLPERIFFGSNVRIRGNVGGFFEFQIQNATGQGVMRSCRIFDGVYLLLNDFHMQNCESRLRVKTPVFCIDYCSEGRIEHYHGAAGFSYIKAGDLRLDDRSAHNMEFSFPLSHYRGLTLAFVTETAGISLRASFPDFSVDPEALRERFCPQPGPCVIRGKTRLGKLFQDLYSIPNGNRNEYLRIKIYEILLILNNLEPAEYNQPQPYFLRPNVEKIKAIRTLMTEHPDAHFTLGELSKRFNIPLTAMKSCFKGVYGMSIYSYMRSFRMNRAALELRKTEKSVAEIACEVGFASPSKFASAFRAVMDVSPLEYRKKDIG